MRRYSLIPGQGTGVYPDRLQPSLADGTPYVVIAYAPGGGRCIVKQPIADGTAADNQTLADLDTTANATDVTATTLSPAQITAVKTRLTAAGIDLSSFDSDGVDDRRKLLRFLLRRWLGWTLVDLNKGLHIAGFDVG